MVRRPVRRLRRVKSKLFFFVVLCGGAPGRAEKNKPKVPDALDVGSDSGTAGDRPRLRGGLRVIEISGSRISR
jgi:hypothetical protein